jgi:hypothetical protein
MRHTMQTWIIIAGLLTYASAIAQEGHALPLPAPFDRYTEVELIRPVYPQFNSKTRLLGGHVVDDEGKARAGELSAAKIWKGEGDVKLSILIEAYTPENGERPSYGAASYDLDLAMFGLANRRLTLEARLVKAHEHSGHRTVTLDLAPYRVKPGVMAVGLRQNYMHRSGRGRRGSSGI